MKYHPQASETQSCDGGGLKETRRCTDTTPPGEMAAYGALFMLLLMGGTVTLVVCEVIRATGSTADTVHSIIMNLPRQGYRRA